MQALRRIVNIDNNTLNISLPSDFTAKRVEIIVLSIDEAQPVAHSKNSERFSGAISVETAKMLHDHLDKVKSEWEKGSY